MNMEQGQEDKTPVGNDDVHEFRKEIDAVIVHAQTFQDVIKRNNISGQREIALVVTKLQEAKMWAGKILEAFGSELPKEFQDKAE